MVNCKSCEAFIPLLAGEVFGAPKGGNFKAEFFLEDRVVEPKNFVLRSEAETVEVDTKTFQGVGVPPNVNWGNFWTLFWKKTCNQ